jgi:hypothetical protein
MASANRGSSFGVVWMILRGILLFPEKEAKSVVPLRGKPQAAQRSNNTGPTI